MIDRETAGDMMHTDLTAVRADTPLLEVARTMLSLDLDAVPVVDAEDHLLGMLTVADLAYLVSMGDSPSQVPSGHYLG